MIALVSDQHAKQLMKEYCLEENYSSLAILVPRPWSFMIFFFFNHFSGWIYSMAEDHEYQSYGRRALLKKQYGREGLRLYVEVFASLTSEKQSDIAGVKGTTTDWSRRCRYSG